MPFPQQVISCELEDVPMGPLADHSYQSSSSIVSCVKGERPLRSSLCHDTDEHATKGALVSASPTNGEEVSRGNPESAATSSPVRWRVLVLLCLLLFGTDYCFDLPGSIGAGEGITIQTYFSDADKVYNQRMNQALYSFYSYPNMVMTIVGGILIDKYLGLRKTTLLMAGTVVVSSFVFCGGIYLSSYPLLVFGRFLFGLAGEPLFVAQSAFISRWFGGSPFLSLVFGMSVSFSRLGGGSSYMLSPVVAEKGGVVAAALVGATFATLSFIAGLLVCLLDADAEANGVIGVSAATAHKEQQRKRKEKLLQQTNSLTLDSSGVIASPTKQELNVVVVLSPSAPSPCDSSTTISDDGSDAPEAAFQLSNITSLPATLWFLALAAMLSYGSTFPFVSISKTFLERTYAQDASNASFTAGLFHLFGAILCPLMGIAVDKVGKSPLWLMLAAAGTLAVLGSFAAVPEFLNPTFAIFILSAFYATFVGALWSFAPFTVPACAGGFGFGVMTAGVNFGLASFPLVTGSILDRYTSSTGAADGDVSVLPSTEGFSYAIAFLMFMALCGLVNAIVLWRVDAATGGILMADLSDRGAKRELRDAELLASWSAKAADANASVA